MSSTISLIPEISWSWSGVDSAAEWSTLISCCIVLLLGGIVSNTFLLLSNDLELSVVVEKITMLLIKNIAVTNIATAVGGLHQSVVSLVWKWNENKEIPFYNFYLFQLRLYFSIVLLICAWHLNKLHLSDLPRPLNIPEQ